MLGFAMHLVFLTSHLPQSKTHGERSYHVLNVKKIFSDVFTSTTFAMSLMLAAR